MALAGRIRSLDLAALPTETRLGLTKRILPFAISERFNLAKAKAPLSRYAALAMLERQLTDPTITETPDLSALFLTDVEIEGIRLASQPLGTGVRGAKGRLCRCR